VVPRIQTNTNEEAECRLTHCICSPHQFRFVTDVAQGRGLVEHLKRQRGQDGPRWEAGLDTEDDAFTGLLASRCAHWSTVSTYTSTAERTVPVSAVHAASLARFCYAVTLARRRKAIS